MTVILVVAAIWLFLIVLAVAILRTAAEAERAAEQRMRAVPPRPAPQRERRRKTATTAALAVALPLAGAAIMASDADAQDCPGARSAPRADAPAVTLCLINAERRARGLSPLGAHARLARAARRHSHDMVARSYFSHVSPGGSSLGDRLRRVGYPRGCAWSGGEALAWGTGSKASPASRVAGWMNSAPHRALLLDQGYRDIGIGVADGSPGDHGRGATYTAEFGRRRC